jgi:drug/metabolite transporter (DMT)-like permease
VNGDVAGVAVALAASLLYASAVGAQALEARRVNVRHALHFSLLERLVRRPLWLAGATAGLLGWVLQATALSFAPLTLVEPTLAASLVFLLAIGAFALHERVGGREVSAVFAIAVGVAGLAVVAPAHSTQHQGGARLVVVILGLTAIVAAPYALPGRVGSSTTLIAVSAGVSVG